MFGVRSPPFHMPRCPTLPPMAFNLISKPWRHSHLRSGSGESLGQLTGQNVANIFPFPFIRWEESWNGYLFHIMSYHVGEGEGQVWAKTPQNFLPFWVWLSWFGCSVGCCRPLTHFQSTLLFTWCFQEGNKGLELPVLTSCWHHLRNKFNSYFMLLKMFKLFFFAMPEKRKNWLGQNFPAPDCSGKGRPQLWAVTSHEHRGLRENLVVAATVPSLSGRSLL